MAISIYDLFSYTIFFGFVYLVSPLYTSELLDARHGSFFYIEAFLFLFTSSIKSFPLNQQASLTWNMKVRTLHDGKNIIEAWGRKKFCKRKGIPFKQWKGLSWRPFSLWLVLPLLIGTIAVLLFSFVGGVFHDAKSHMRRQGNNTWNNDKACYRAWCVIHFPSPKKLSVFFYKYFSPITSQIKELVFP